MNPAFMEKKSFFPSEIVNHSLSVPHVFKEKAKKNKTKMTFWSCGNGLFMVKWLMN